MKPINLPPLPEVVVNGIVAVRSEDLKIIVDAFNSLAEVVTAQQTVIESQATHITDCRGDITKIAKILEDIYET